MSLDIIIAFYNPPNNWEKIVCQKFKELRKFFSNCEISLIIINDGSTDLTGQIAEEFAKSHKFISSYHQEQNQGFGGWLAG